MVHLCDPCVETSRSVCLNDMRQKAVHMYLKAIFCGVIFHDSSTSIVYQQVQWQIPLQKTVCESLD